MSDFIDENQRADHARFVDLCKALLALGATSVVSGAYSATFPAPPQSLRVQPAPTPTRQPAKTNSEPKDDDIPMLPGDGPGDRERRKAYRDIDRVISGT